ncbi:hypothetical protein HII31_06108 [Pseudocercospora fuligena]|uniref:Uncharacterized protein n=1 Tax=Pseudocercospora fuligena TaxID=685502 RepID=A0A8H6RM16_9PEZI|nr:hypothetical protein HII31_06108 [Pseudocercospora fuligena]
MSNSPSRAFLVDQSEFEDVALTPLGARVESDAQLHNEAASKRCGRIFLYDEGSDQPAVETSDRTSVETALRRFTVGGSMEVPEDPFIAESNAASPNASTRALLEESWGDDTSSIYSRAADVDLEESTCDCSIRANRDRHALPPSIVEKNAMRVGSPQEAYQHMEMLPRRAADEVLYAFHSAENSPDVDIEIGTIDASSPYEQSGLTENIPSGLFGRKFQIRIHKQQKQREDAALGSVDQAGSDPNPGYFQRQRRKSQPLQNAFRRRSTIRWQDPPPDANLQRRKTVTTCREVTSTASDSNAGVDDVGRTDEWRDSARVERFTRASFSAVASTKRKASRSLSKTWGNIGDFGKKTQRGFLKVFRQDSAMALESPSAEYPFASGALPADMSVEDIGGGSAVNDEERLANFPYRDAILLPEFKLPSPLTGIASPHYSLSSDLAPESAAGTNNGREDAAGPDDVEKAAILEGMDHLERMVDPPKRNVPAVGSPQRVKSPIAIEIDSAMKKVRAANLAVTPPRIDIRQLAADNRKQSLLDASNALNRAVIAGDFKEAKIQKYFDKVPRCTDKAKQRGASISFREEVASEQERLHKAYLESLSESEFADDAPLILNKRHPSSEGHEEVQRDGAREGASQSKTKVAVELAAVAGIVGNVFQGAGAPMMM